MTEDDAADAREWRHHQANVVREIVNYVTDEDYDDDLVYDAIDILDDHDREVSWSAEHRTREEIAACLTGAVALGEWALDVSARLWWQEGQGPVDWVEMRPFALPAFQAMLRYESSQSPSEGEKK